MRVTSSRSATSASRKPVRVVDGGEGLDEERLPRARGVVDDAGHATAGRRPQRQHGPAAALGDEVVLQVLRQCRVAGDLAEALGEPTRALAKGAAEPAELGRRRVAEIRAVLLDRPTDLLGDREQ